ncbi:unnamed protein product [Linum tenue]|uniref:Uncharacterized protein n=1 Tax=Linum tenue TaxID=586396 RepID=A0AAV0RNJ0_9ROSI|nr:unnamed protein product [Linum tenue]
MKICGESLRSRSRSWLRFSGSHFPNWMGMGRWRRCCGGAAWIG